MPTTYESPAPLEVAVSDMRERSGLDTVAICRTCPRDLPNSGEVGRALYDGVREKLIRQGMTVMMVHCLGSCRAPCAVALDAPAKSRIRLSGLKDVNTADLVNAALAYREAASNDVTVAALPAVLQRHVTAISPKRKRSTA